MNLDQTTAIRIAIRDTLNQLRPPVMGAGHSEPTRTALQTHLDALLKEELRALTGQALEVDLAAEFAESEQTRAKCAALRQDTPWYPDDSGEWVEGHPRDLPPTTDIADWLYRGERERRNYCQSACSESAGYLSRMSRIVAYKVVTP